MKTILIPVYQAVEVKNILRTDIIKKLLDRPDIRVVCLVRHAQRAEHYKKEISHDRILYDTFYAAPRGPFEHFFSVLKFHTIRTDTTDLKRRLRYEAEGGTARYKIGLAINGLLARKRIRRLLRFFDYRIVGDPGFGDILRRYMPDAVFLAHLFGDVETSLLREAQKRHIPTIGFINSWDKMTARCGLRLLPDKLVVYNDAVKQEAMAHADMPEARICVCGIPQYDYYSASMPCPASRFFNTIGLDATRPMVLYAPQGETFSNSDWDMIDLLAGMISDGTIKKNAQLFVRFQPNDSVTESELAKRPWLKYDRPGIRYGTERGGDWDMTFADLDHLRDTLAYASLLVCHASSISVDAAVMGKPVININFEIKQGTDPRKSPMRYFLMEHYRKVIKTGGIRLVNGKEELAQWINAYLENPALDADARASLVRQQLGTPDGRAGERIAGVILQEINA